MHIPVKTRDFSPTDKLIQSLVSILAGCETLSEVNSRLKSEVQLARVWHWKGFTDQSNLARTLDALTLKQIDQLRTAATGIWHAQSQTRGHDWRGYLWLDFDLSGLPCGKHAEASQKGYFAGKKTLQDASSHGSVPRGIAKPSGLSYIRVANIPYAAYARRSAPRKML